MLLSKVFKNYSRYSRNAKKLFKTYSRAVAFSLLLSLSISSQVYAGTSKLGPGMGDSITVQLEETLDDNWIVHGLYAMDKNSGNIYYSEDGESFVKDTIGSDGHVYDENGVQENSMIYVRDKYYETYENTPESGKIKFDTEQEARLFVCWLQSEKGGQQGIPYSQNFLPDGSALVTKSSLLQIQETDSTAYDDVVLEICSTIPEGSIREKVRLANIAVAQYLTYDFEYRLSPMADAVAARRGVCYHYVKLLKKVLNAMNITSEPMCGIIENTDSAHIWLRVWNEEEGKWIYVDPTSASASLVNGLFPVDIYEAFVGYSQFGVNYVPKIWKA